MLRIGPFGVILAKNRRSIEIERDEWKDKHDALHKQYMNLLNGRDPQGRARP